MKRGKLLKLKCLSVKLIDINHCLERRKFTNYTEVHKTSTISSMFPKIAYSLVPFDILKTRIDNINDMSDVIGRLTTVGHTTTAYVKGIQKSNRKLYLTDGRESIEAMLWGRQAIDFPAEQIIEESKRTPIIILLLGVTCKSREGQLKLQGSTTCQWHINPIIPEAIALQDRFKAFPYEVSWLNAPTTSTQTISTSINDLANIINPHKIYGNTYQVNVVIKTLKPNQPWWYLGCTSCHKRVLQEGDSYRCPKCAATTAEPMYRITLVAIDPTNLNEEDPKSIEIVFFGTTGEQLTGVPALTLAASSTINPTEIPLEITRLYGHKYTLKINVSFSSMQQRDISFQVRSIINAYGPVVPVLSTTSKTPGSTSAHTDSSISIDIPQEQHKKETKNLSTVAETTPPEHITLATDVQQSSKRHLTEENSDLSDPKNIPSKRHAARKLDFKS
ncbi:replication protein A 70 kDa DNA-binding subunit D-like isoform X7 [Phragmites australis]|uniref:replication protein A 70 kDa DNA-binding subunit D-like isoform X7 n=1 Tax=Phragmites australis TaxID=29695 RepID=UPI002D798547|nr:replication protein A 70 kDa DNA-binding subunit D-like isoform X7 [Phragmites australis]